MIYYLKTEKWESAASNFRDIEIKMVFLSQKINVVYKLNGIHSAIKKVELCLLDKVDGVLLIILSVIVWQWRAITRWFHLFGVSPSQTGKNGTRWPGENYSGK